MQAEAELSKTERVSREACVVRHVAFEDLGTFAPVLEAGGFELSVMDAGVDDVFEPMLHSDLVVVLGGPIGVYDHVQYPFLTDEIRALAKRMREGRPTLGICLGAQLMAAALGARVYPGGRKEIGWGAVSLTEAGRASCLSKLEGQPVVHWHGDTFELPAEATLLASTDLYAHQAFSIGDNVLALQFHPEVDGRRFEQWLIGHAGELAAAGSSVTDFRAQVRQGAAALRGAAGSMLAHWLERVSFE